MMLLEVLQGSQQVPVRADDLKGLPVAGNMQNSIHA